MGKNHLKLEILDILIKWFYICHELNVTLRQNSESEGVGDWHKLEILRMEKFFSLFPTSVQLINKSDQKQTANKFSYTKVNAMGKGTETT